MVESGRKRIPGEALINLRRRLDTLGTLFSMARAKSKS
jgi:hypothetical protein